MPRYGLGIMNLLPLIRAYNRRHGIMHCVAMFGDGSGRILPSHTDLKDGVVHFGERAPLRTILDLKNQTLLPALSEYNKKMGGEHAIVIFSDGGGRILTSPTGLDVNAIITFNDRDDFLKKINE